MGWALLALLAGHGRPDGLVRRRPASPARTASRAACLMAAPPALTVDTGDPTPPYEQLRRQLAGLIQSAVLTPGGWLPPLRQLAADLGLAVGTVARAYRELESAGLVTSRRGGGTRVNGTAPSAA